METKKAKIIYLLSEEGRKKSLLNGGDGKEVQVIETDITPELLEVASVSPEGDVTLHVGYQPNGRYHDPVPMELELYAPGWREPSIDTKKRIKKEFNAPQTAEALLGWERERRARLAAQEEALKPELEKALAEWGAKEAERRVQKEAEEAKRRAEQEAREARLKAEREAREAEKLTWVKEHGSEYLRDAVTLGYDCQRQYVTERAAIEFPDYVVDFDDLAAWKSRSCPSREALQEVKDLVAKGYGAEVVWLTSPPWELGEYEVFKPCEAIIIRDYLGKYDLVKIV